MDFGNRSLARLVGILINMMLPGMTDVQLMPGVSGANMRGRSIAKAIYFKRGDYMDKAYTEIQFALGSTIDDAVNELLKSKEEGKLVYGSFNGIKLYSDTVTIDSAYRLITGKSKAKFDEFIG